MAEISDKINAFGYSGLVSEHMTKVELEHTGVASTAPSDVSKEDIASSFDITSTSAVKCEATQPHIPGIDISRVNAVSSLSASSPCGIPPSAASSSSSTYGSFGIGDRVEARFMQGHKWFPGSITGKSSGDGDGTEETFDVLYDDGDDEKAVPVDRIRHAVVEGSSISLQHASSTSPSPNTPAVAYEYKVGDFVQVLCCQDNEVTYSRFKAVIILRLIALIPFVPPICVCTSHPASPTPNPIRM